MIESIIVVSIVSTIFFGTCICLCILWDEICKQKGITRQKRIRWGTGIYLTFINSALANASFAVAQKLIANGTSEFRAYLVTGVPLACVLILLSIWVSWTAAGLPGHSTAPPQRTSQPRPSRGSSNPRLVELQRQLVRMVGGQIDVACRLVSCEKARLPGKPEVWYWEAAIERLLSDRR